MSLEKNNDVVLKIKMLEKRMERIEKLLKGKTFARFKHVKANYKWIKDIYARLDEIKNELSAIRKVIKVDDTSIHKGD